MERSLGTILALTLWLATPAIGWAQASGESEDEEGAAAMRTEGLDDEQARSRFRVGQALYMEGRFLEAAEEFENSYRLSGRRSLLYNAYLSYRDAGQLAEAVRTLELYLEGDEDAEDAAQLRQRLEAMRVTLAEEQAAEAAARTERERERAEAQRQLEEAERRAEEERRRAEAAEQELNPVGWIIGGIGAGLLAGAAVAGGLAQNALGDLEDNCPNDRCVVGYDLESERKEVERPRLAADILLFTGVATVATGIVVLFVGRGGASDDATPEPTTTGSLGCGPTGCLGTLRTRF